MKILINIPCLDLIGGVVSQYVGLAPYWTEDIKYNVVGKRTEKKYTGIYWILWDIIKFISVIFRYRPNAVMLNPSLGKTAVLRDMTFLVISSALGKKTFVFIHGWDKEFAQKLNKKWFARLCNRATGVFVLASEFKKELLKWGIKVPILPATTKVDNRLLESFDIDSRDGHIKTILFLARIEIEKGIFIAIDTFKILKQKYPEIKFKIAGTGSALAKSQKYVTDNKILDVEFTGNLSGDDLIDAFKSGDLYILPSYTEGMPTSVLEAMAFGLPVITRPVGGLSDILKNDLMGYTTKSLNPESFARRIELLINSPEECLKMSQFNYQYAKDHFMASEVAKYIERTIKNELKTN